MRSSASFDLGADFDYMTGELNYAETEGGTGLSLPSTASPEPDAVEAALADAEQSACERYVEPYGDDPLQSQGFDIKFLMYDTLSAAATSTYSEEYLAAYEDVQAWVDANGPSTSGLSVGSAQYEQASAERDALWEKRWESEHSELSDERTAITEMRRKLLKQLFTSDKVREAQDFYIHQCGIEVSDGYEYPTPDELGITVDDEYVAELEQAMADAEAES